MTAAKFTRKGCRRLGCAFVLLVAAVATGAFAFAMALRPTDRTEPQYVRWNQPQSLRSALDDLEKRGFVRSAAATHLYARFRRVPARVSSGTYQLRGGLLPDALFEILQKPIRQMVRLPETNWASRTARLLESKGVTTAEEYMRYVNNPQHFQPFVNFPLPQKGSLEGYLFPDTYDLPPLLGAEQVILRQLRNFERRVIPILPDNVDLHRVLTVASMVELEAKLDSERSKIAGVIENRLRRGMRLQIDATVLYGLQEWRRLTFRDYYETDSPYNTYRIDGLPPGPINSPSLASIRGALNPDRHDYLFYVALPSGEHLFSRTYDEHRQNIRRRQQALRESGQ